MLQFDDSRYVDAKQYHLASLSTRNSTLNTSLRKPIRMQDFSYAILLHSTYIVREHGREISSRKIGERKISEYQGERLSTLFEWLARICRRRRHTKLDRRSFSRKSCK